MLDAVPTVEALKYFFPIIIKLHASGWRYRRRTENENPAPLGAYLLAAITHGIQDMGGGVILMAVAMSMSSTLQGAEVDVNDPTAGPEIISENLRWITRIEAILINIIILPIVIALFAQER